MMARDPALPPQGDKRLRQRNLAVALGLGALVVLFFIITLIKGVPLLNRPL